MTDFGSDNGGTAAGRKSRKASGHKQVTEKEGAIGAGLRSLYQNVLEEPLPDEFLTLLDQLDSQDRPEAG
ncbi:NepR family anti-sigma factor [Sphingorhabdus arenilitoris]|uniref:NepR family anti-sigma factor n=1 Tax=Sphingorhabdus arenilitoris TaxID=1490041 RepID=A0ABV8RFH8_9SPHN